MKRAIAVTSLTDKIVLARTDDGELLSISVPCRRIPSTTMLMLDLDTDGCPIAGVDGKVCRESCHRTDQALIIRQKDDAPGDIPALKDAADRDVI